MSADASASSRAGPGAAVVQDELSVSTAEALLRADPAVPRPLADQAVRERWERPRVRAALARCDAALQGDGLARRVDGLAAELEDVEPDALEVDGRRAVERLLASTR
jgi:hypothetical protein